MTVKDVFLEYHAKVPFPWSISKIKKAGFKPTQLLLGMGRKLEQCEDKDTPAAKAVLDTLTNLRMFDI